MALEMTVRKSEQGIVVACVGRLVFGDETTELRALVKDVMAEDPRIVLDLAGVRDIDSGGVGTLVGLYTSAVNAGGELKLARANSKVSQTLSITRLLGIIRAYESLEDALAAFPSTSPRRANAS